MMLLALTSAALLAPMLAVALWNLLAAPRLERAGSPRALALARASVLLPARNEADNLRATLPALLRLEHPDLEILVLDDGSEDDTAAVVESHLAGGSGRLRLLRGLPLPEGWLGKNWACHQLAQAARGEVLIFCDADVTAHPAALRRTLAAMERAGAGVLTALPKQRLDSWVESAVVPLVAHLPVLTLLPLPLVARVRAPSLSMANGQWLAFTREAYRGCGGHAAVRAEVVEDVALGRRAKAAKHRLLPVVASSLLEVRMYRDASALREGFGKNLYALAGGRPAPFLGALLVFLMTAVFPWAGAALGVPGAMLPLALLVAVRGCGAILFRHRPGSLLLHPVGSVLLIALALWSCAGARRGRLRWKGRRIDAAMAAANPAAAPSDIPLAGPRAH
jgi:chlorobactene glucosyltransferase